MQSYVKPREYTELQIPYFNHFTLHNVNWFLASLKIHQEVISGIKCWLGSNAKSFFLSAAVTAQVSDAEVAIGGTMARQSRILTFSRTFLLDQTNFRIQSKDENAKAILLSLSLLSLGTSQNIQICLRFQCVPLGSRCYLQTV